MNGSGALWIGAIVLAFVFLDVLFVELRRIFRELNRLSTRMEAYGELPLFALIAAGERDMERIALAVEAVPPLVVRGRRAIAVLRGYLPKGSSPG